MLRKAIGLLTAAVMAVSSCALVSAADSTAPELNYPLYKLDLKENSTLDSLGITAPAGAWSIEQGTEGKLCLKASDAKASLMVGESEWQNYTAVINCKVIQNDAYELVSPAQNSSTYNMIRVSVCPRNVDGASDGKYCKYVYTNPPRWSGKYLQEYYYDGNSNVRYESTDEKYAVGRNAMQTISVTNYNSGDNVKFITSINGNETDEQSVYSKNSSADSKGPLAVIFEDVVKGHTFEDMGYSVEVYGMEVYGEKPTVLPVSEKTYTGTLYKSDFENAADVAATGIDTVSGEWEIADGSEGKKCLKGTLSSGAASLIWGDESWTDAQTEIAYKIVQQEGTELSSSNRITSILYTRNGNTLGSGDYVQYRFDNPAYYSNYFGGYSRKNGTGSPAIVGSLKSGTNESAMMRTNALQTVKVSDTNRAGTNGATVTHSVEFSNGTDAAYTASASEWAGSGSGILSGKTGIKFTGAAIAYVEIYSIKTVGAKTFTLKYLNEKETAAEELVPNGEITVTGEMSDCIVNSKEYSPVLVTAVYDGDTLYDVKMQKADDTFSYKVKLPQNTENCNIKTFVWGSAESIYPIFGAMSGLNAE